MWFRPLGMDFNDLDTTSHTALAPPQQIGKIFVVEAGAAEDNNAVTNVVGLQTGSAVANPGDAPLPSLETNVSLPVREQSQALARTTRLLWSGMAHR